MSQEILQRLLKPAEPVRRFGEVVEVKPDGRYVVKDDQERTFTIDGDKGYLPGIQVVVIGGRIVGLGLRKPASKVFRV